VRCDGGATPSRPDKGRNEAIRLWKRHDYVLNVFVTILYLLSTKNVGDLTPSMDGDFALARGG
jgi:hypothetical protein